ncbi:MAG: phytanoyl-CoA dioxygenase family protein [Verrucomicrobia bacterium]|nr:phytanoyl-CoA dioxygenase family protein [Cytophagales bacterium]
MFLTTSQIQTYHQDGYLIIRNLFSQAEIERLYAVAIGDEAMLKNAFGTVDKSGKQTRLTLWYTPGDDIYGLLTRSRRMVEPVGQLLASQSPVCHYHSKLMQKEPRVGGAWEWHQDYGYWYKNQFMFPDQLISVMVAITDANQANGCLQVIKSSHKLGRVNHGFSGEQVGADIEMVNNALKTMELVYCELKAGDVLFFHANTLHRSEANFSETARWSMISCYNSQANLAYNEPSVAYKIPVSVVPDEAILTWETAAVSAKADFLHKENDNALKETTWGSL